MNEIYLNKINTLGNKVQYQYTVSGKWSTYFLNKTFIEIEYNINVDDIPKSVLAIPFLGAILPLLWLQDATIYIDELDYDFNDCIKSLRDAYQKMIPQLTFEGKVVPKTIVCNTVEKSNRSLVMFSGGVDAFTTFFRHKNECPDLLTIWGADLPLKDIDGWKAIYEQTKEVAQKYNLKSTYIKSPFREFLDEEKLNGIVKIIDDNFWHAVQHSIGLLSQVAPYAFARGINKIYIASSFPMYMIEKGDIICASDPRTDNLVRFCGSQVYHDGVEFDRQGKIHYLVHEAKRDGEKIPLRVCFLNHDGVNCCHCEKCYRTILQLVSEGENPNNFGFSWDRAAAKRCEHDMKYTLTAGAKTIEQNYLKIRNNMIKNKSIIKNYDDYVWIEKMDFSKFNDYPAKKLKRTILYRGIRKAVRIIIKKGK